MTRSAMVAQLESKTIEKLKKAGLFRGGSQSQRELNRIDDEGLLVKKDDTRWPGRHYWAWEFVREMLFEHHGITVRFEPHRTRLMDHRFNRKGEELDPRPDAVLLQGLPTMTFEGRPRHPSLADWVHYCLCLREGKEPHFTIDSVGIPPKWRPVSKTKGGEDFVRLLQGLPVRTPPNVLMPAVAKWHERLMEGVPSTIYCPVCPDWETEKAEDGREVYTFNGLGRGMGLVARRALPALVRLYQFFSQFEGIDLRFVVAIGDNECNEASCKRVGLTRDEFMARLEASNRAFKAACPSSMPLGMTMVTQMLPDMWDIALEDIAGAIASGNTGAFPLSEKDWTNIFRARESLLRRWMEKSGETLDIEATVRSQAAEYGAFATIADLCYGGDNGNLLLVGADSVANAPFYQGGTKTPRAMISLATDEY